MWIEATSGSGGGVTPTPITPSNTSPAAMTGGQAYQPSANGYAIESYDSVTPSSTPEQVASGDMVKVDGPGVIVDAVPPTPTPITPSNASPASLGANIPVEPTTNGWAIQSYSDITPGNPPVYMTQGNIYKAAASGWAIDDYSDITPTSDGAYFASGIRRMMTSGYACSQQPSIFALLKDLPSSAKTTASATANISVTSGKHYLLAVCGIFTSATPTTSITGGTVEWEMPLVNTQASNSRYSLMKVYLLTATTSSLQVNFGSGTNGRGYVALQLD